MLNKHLRKLFPLLFVAVIISGCRNTEKTFNGLTVTILPLKYIVDRITDGSVPVEVIVPPGSSPETYEPTPKQMANLERSSLVVSTGLLDFERNIIHKAAAELNIPIANLSSGIDLIEGHCAHIHRQPHTHGVDPHIWTAPRELLKMAETAHGALLDLYPDSLSFSRNYAKLAGDLIYLDKKIEDILRAHDVKQFIIYHPALSYYSRNYNIKQIAIEQEGKEPSADYLRQLISQARANDVKIVLYQKEFNYSVVKTVTEDIGAETAEIDPLAENIIDNILIITKLIALNGSIN